MANSGNRQIENITFFGGMDSDTAPELLVKGDYIYALNIDNSSTGEGNVGIVTNTRGNQMVNTPLPLEGENKCIGRGLDEENNKFYFFVWNSEGYHTIYEYDYLSNSVLRLLTDKLDTNGAILNFSEDSLILHVNVVDGKIYWVDGLNPARKFNILKMKNRGSQNGYPTVINEYHINASKNEPAFPPLCNYVTDNTKQGNSLYGHLFKVAYRYIYDDGEISNWSDYSKVPLSKKHLKGIPTPEDNCIQIQLNTSTDIVTKIEVAVKIDNGDFYSVYTLDKKKIGLNHNVNYEYNFYNNGSYAAVNAEKIIRPYSYFPKNPLCQEFVNRAMVYMNFKEGFEDVMVDLSAELQYKIYDDAGSTNDVFNSPKFELYGGDGSTYWILRGDKDGNPLAGITFISQFKSRRWRITIGSDVISGNIFSFTLKEVLTPSRNIVNYVVDTYFYTATEFDDAKTVAIQIKNKIKSVRRVTKETDVIVDSAGNATFEVFITSRNQGDYGGYIDIINNNVTASKRTTKITDNSSIPTIKGGSSYQYGIVYEDVDGRKSGVYTNSNWTIQTPFMFDFKTNGFPYHTLIIKHKAPEWAVRYQIVRTENIIKSDFIQILTQSVSDIEVVGGDSFTEIVIGSLVTYNKIYPNSILKYEFKKGDRLVFIKNLDADTPVNYNYKEIEILEYKDYTEVIKNENITADKTNKVTIEKQADDSNIGKFIKIDGETREIISVDGNKYVLDTPLEKNEKYSSYVILDFRGSVKIKKDDVNIDYGNFNLIEIFTPSYLGDKDNNRVFYSFGEKYGINDGKHLGNSQNQSETEPAKITITSGDSYVRLRQLPISNNIKNRNTKVELVEDANFSDFFESKLNDNGKAYVIDDNPEVKKFGDRARFSNNYIQDTRINGLNDFDNSDRFDFNDQYGDVSFIKYDGKRLFIFKELRTGYSPVLSRILEDQSGQSLVGLSSKLLNEMQYFSWVGGIGNAAESFAQNGNQMYFASPNSSVIIRLSTDGETPISEVYKVDKRIRDLFMRYNKYGGKIHGGFDRLKGEYIVFFDVNKDVIFKDQFFQGQWITNSSLLDDSKPISIVNQPLHGSVSIIDGMLSYTPNTDYLGKDSIEYSATDINGNIIQKKICIDVIDDFTPVISSEFFNTVASMNFTKNDCGNGFTGSVVTYTVPARKYRSVISQADADNLATNDLASNGQNYANANGTCIALPTFKNVRLEQTFSKNNCESGKTGTTVLYVVEAGTYESTISQVDANAKAQADIDANGQTYANINGSCVNQTTPCGNATQYNGGQSFPTEIEVVLGTDKGNVKFDFNAFNVPDKFVVIYEGQEVVNTGYRGDLAQQSSLNTELANRGLPSETIQGVGTGTVTWFKATDTITATVKVYAPISGTAWNFTMNCPILEKPNTSNG